MKKIMGPILIISLLVVTIILLNAFYVVDETNQVVITQFGEPMGDAKKAPGLYLKTPFIQKVNYFDKRLMEWDGDPNRIPTEDKKYLWVDTTARWRIVDPLKFFQTVHDEIGAQSRLDDILDNATRIVVARHQLIETVRDSNRILSVEQSEDDKIMGRQFESIREGTGRAVMQKEMIERARPQVSQFGIELVDFRIKRIDYDTQVRKKVFDRMISERNRAAELLRSQGIGEQAQIEGKKVRELQRVQSEAYRNAQMIRGKADAEAIAIYKEAYSRDPEYYSFVNTLESYRRAFEGQSTIVLTTDNEFFKYLNSVSE